MFLLGLCFGLLWVLLWANKGFCEDIKCGFFRVLDWKVKYTREMGLFEEK